jgi:2-C-methyl-D-erythritol 4-phosphate cytidylyltransferase/2-C-methyl-D-erythritol 4-phosphate cytidylyltransferase/2-C-methyl-D-erythritol 2,4-cyclodiphosphate synthase
VSFPPHGVIITAAGTSTRFNGSKNSSQKKEFLLLDDRSVLYHAALPFFSLPNLEFVVVTYSEGLREETEVALDNLLFASPIPVQLVLGGKTRQESVLKGLEALEHYAPNISYVLIHDGARPWVSEKTIISTLAMATVFGGAAPILPIHDAVKRLDSEGKILNHEDRSGLVMIQTPQVFRFPEILQAHRKATRHDRLYVDDTEIYTDFGGLVGTTPGNPENRKITIADDFPQIKEQL